MLKRSPASTIGALIAFAAVAGAAGEARATLGFNVATSGWPNDAHRTAAVNAIQSSVNRYNAYGDFGNYNVHVYYNAGIPTAQANYLGSIGFGGTYPNERVMMHELAHYLGSGTYGDPWNGTRGEALVDQFDGLEATLQGDANHFWPYGLNYDSEGSEINKQRQVAMVYAQRADMGIGSTANPWSASVVNLTASDAFGTSGFNYASTWSDNRFAHPGAAYSTGDFLLRTPASGNSFTFVGESVRVNNTNGINGGLLYKGTGTTGVIAFNDLILDGGYVRHANGAGDLFRLGGKVTLVSPSTIDAAQGAVVISASIGGSGSFTKTGSFPLTLTGDNTYSGGTTVNSGTVVAGHANALGSGALAVANGATARAQAGLTSAFALAGLTVGGTTGKLDLTDAALVVRDGGQGVTRQVTAHLRRGLENGGNFDWQGPGISSTEAFNDNTTAGSVLYGLGVVQNNLAAAGTADGTTTDATAGNEIYTTFKGRTVSLNDTLVRYTYMGDADLDGSVTGTDYSLIDNGFAFALNGWLNGDFDYSGSIDGTDYALIDNAFAFQVGPLSEPFLGRYNAHVALFGQSYVDALAAVQSGVVPEPASLTIAIASATLLLVSGRRRGRGRIRG